jgi:regulator of sigma E protease
MTTQMNEQGAEIQRFTVGIVPAMLMSIPDNFELRTLHPGKALVRGSQLTWHWTKFTLLSFLRLIQNRVSAKNISGVISIGQVASRSFQVGMSAFLTIMAIISINLFVLNLLPIPILDGGHLVFFTIEALRGAPLSMKKLEMAQQVGLVLLLGLMAFALFNDVTRLLNFSW